MIISKSYQEESPLEERQFAEPHRVREQQDIEQRY